MHNQTEFILCIVTDIYYCHTLTAFLNSKWIAFYKRIQKFSQNHGDTSKFKAQKEWQK